MTSVGTIFCEQAVELSVHRMACPEKEKNTLLLSSEKHLPSQCILRIKRCIVWSETFRIQQMDKISLCLSWEQVLWDLVIFVISGMWQRNKSLGLVYSTAHILPVCKDGNSDVIHFKTSTFIKPNCNFTGAKLQSPKCTKNQHRIENWYVLMLLKTSTIVCNLLELLSSHHSISTY